MDVSHVLAEWVPTIDGPIGEGAVYLIVILGLFVIAAWVIATFVLFQYARTLKKATYGP